MNRNTTRCIALLAVLTLSACRFGTMPNDIDWVNSPEGARIALRVVGEPQDRVGELLAVDDDGVVMRVSAHDRGVVLRRPMVTRVFWTRIDAIDVDRLGGGYDIRRGQRVTPGERRKLTLISRFPQGISADLMTKLLAASKQAVLEEMK